MNPPFDRRRFLIFLCAAAMLSLRKIAGAKEADRPGESRRPKRRAPFRLPAELSSFAEISLMIGRVTGTSAVLSALSAADREGYFEYGPLGAPGIPLKTATMKFPAGVPVETGLEGLSPDSEYVWRLKSRTAGAGEFESKGECRFHTARAPGSAFVFTVQGDSHPERPWMCEPALYARTLTEVAGTGPDFHLCMGDDFSVEGLPEVTPAALEEPYRLQRPFLGIVGRTAPVFLLNGNHEQASLFNYSQHDERHAVAVGAQRARNRFYPTPGPGAFYSGDARAPEEIGPLKDYCAWTWGDALFVILDYYWGSPVSVDSPFREGKPVDGVRKKDPAQRKDWWELTLGDEQYAWFKRTLEQSRARHKFVFTHHVLGSGRGGVEGAHLYEWGGKNKRGDDEFARRRPGWEAPVHALMVKHGVTVFFQGHDHLYVKQELDGVVYQEVPMPADPEYVAYNADRYLSGVKLGNSGYLRVSVSPEAVTVDYIRTYLPRDETSGRKTGAVSHGYTIRS